jgi:hypothetical protein
MVTINSIVKVLEDFKNAHDQLETFHFGTDIESVSNIRYRLLWSFCSDTNVGYNTTTYTFDIVCLDRLEKDKSNERDIYNDTALILQDLKAYLQNNLNNEIILDDDVEFKPVGNEINTDFVSGWKGSFKIQVPFNDDLCIIPGIGSGIQVDECPECEDCPECEQCPDPSTDFDTEAPFTYAQEADLWTEHVTSWSYEGSSDQYLSLNYSGLTEGWYLFEITFDTNTNGLTLSGFNGQTFDVNSAGVYKVAVYNTESENPWLIVPHNANALVSFDKSSVKFRRFL